MAKETKPVNNANKIGQMYEERKSGRVGVIESVDEKFKTYMMRDKEGKSFNITFATLKSNWRKYQGEEVVQTSTQVEEQKAEEEKKVEQAEKVVKERTSSVSLSTEEKVKAVRALETVIEEHIKSNDSVLSVSRKSRGGVIVRYKKFSVFEVWVKYGLDKYDFFFRRDVASTLTAKEFKSIAAETSAEYKEREDWPLGHIYRVSNENLGAMLDKLIEICDKFANEKEEANDKNEEEEKN